MNDEKSAFSGPGAGGATGFPPVEPGSDLSRKLVTGGPTPPEDGGRASLVLFLGLLSLFMCGPLGIIAWIMANADLKKIRAGALSPRQAGTLKIGRALGIIGTIVFVISIFVFAHLLQRGITGLGGWTETSPLLPNQIVFVGEWVGKKGTVIRIRPDGKGDFRSSHSSMTGGQVRIDKDDLSIGLMGISKSWHIDAPPHLTNGSWEMSLDGEIFIRKGEDLTV
ncbi:MAG: hypothetical protein HY913_17990 [Desulfomonile tiedjei]|nr:hypothetical protein [Desulfomonile tiedjei]